MKRVRTLVVDDSATVRTLISNILSRDPGIEVIGQARDAAQARQMIKELNPDVITLDVEMPNMNGLEFLEKIMRLRPMPVIMVSTLTSRGADATIRALEIGAVDCVCKPTPDNENSLDSLPALVKSAADAPLRPLAQRTSDREAQASRRPETSWRPGNKLLAIGSSTGGVEALITILSELPKNCPPTVICQHMPGTFTRSFAERLDRLCAPTVAEATDGAAVSTGHVYIAPGGAFHLEITGGDVARCRLRAADPVNGHRPSVDVLFSSVAKVAGDRAVGIILTGMGRDGADGLLTMRRAGARTIGQDKGSCVVYGMPRVAFEIGAVEKQVPLHRIGSEILELTHG